MDIRYDCPTCQAQFRIDAKYAGRKGKCPKCGAEMLVPASDAAASQPTVEPAARPAAKPPAPSIAPKQVEPAPAAAASAFDGIGAASSGRTGATRSGGTGSVAQQRMTRRGKKSNQSSTLLVGAMVSAAALVLIGAVAGILAFAGNSGAVARSEGQPANEGAPDSEENRIAQLPTNTSGDNRRSGSDDAVNDLADVQLGSDARESDSGESDFAGIELGSEAPDTMPEEYNEDASEGFGDDWTQNFYEAQQEAVNSGKKLLVLFTGSDWCPHCRRLKQAVLLTDEFRDYADSRFVKVVLDFPKSPAAQSRVLDAAQNADLRKKYAVRGFPTVVLATADGEAYASLGGGGGGAAAYVARLQAEEH